MFFIYGFLLFAFLCKSSSWTWDKIFMTTKAGKPETEQIRKCWPQGGLNWLNCSENGIVLDYKQHLLTFEPEMFSTITPTGLKFSNFSVSYNPFFFCFFLVPEGFKGL